MFNDKPRPTKFDVNDPEKQFPIGCVGVFDANGECLSPVVSCDTATGEVTRYVMTPDGNFTISEDLRLVTATEMRPGPLRIEVRPVDVESQYQLAKAAVAEFARRGILAKKEFKGSDQSSGLKLVLPAMPDSGDCTWEWEDKTTPQPEADPTGGRVYKKAAFRGSAAFQGATVNRE